MLVKGVSVVSFQRPARDNQTGQDAVRDLHLLSHLLVSAWFDGPPWPKRQTSTMGNRACPRACNSGGHYYNYVGKRMSKYFLSYILASEIKICRFDNINRRHHESNSVVTGSTECCASDDNCGIITTPCFQCSTHWGRAMDICVSKLPIIGSDNGLSPGRRQAIIWINTGLLLIGPLRRILSDIFIKILTFSFKKMGFKVSSAKLRPFCLGLNVLKLFSGNDSIAANWNWYIHDKYWRGNTVLLVPYGHNAIMTQWWRLHYVKTTSATSFWRSEDVIIALCARWVGSNHSLLYRWVSARKT